jgi:hypothetical protein
MDIHKPKPWHSVREFLKEYLIIVVGVLTALGAEQAVEALHERGLAREAGEAIAAEMQDNVNRIAFRQAQQSCIDTRLKAITGLLADWAAGKAPPPGLFLGDPGDFPMVQQRWQANLNSGRFSRQSGAEQGQQAEFYTQLAILQEMESREHYVWSELRTLELGPGVLRLDLRPNLVAALQSARTDASDIGQLGGDMLKTARRSGHTPKPTIIAAIAPTTCQPLIPSGQGDPLRVR